jgi:flagellar biosynthesis protein FliQ
LTPDVAVHILRQALIMMAWIAAPILIMAFLAGIVISLIQIVTSIQDAAFATIPRLAVFLVTFILLLPWMINRLMSYTTSILGNLGQYAR